uniref:Uncharacterized protein MANES_11G072000 n=1 Tax=Rhizophora mucronata TaxID=61149 RepID=A0A2P2MV54_RHIMU
MASNILITITHEGPHQCGSSVEYCHLEFVNNFPTATRIRIIWSPFKNNNCSSIEHGSVSHIAMPSDPATVSCAPVDVRLFVIKCILECCGSVNHIPSSCMENTLWLSSAPTGI